MQIIEWDGEPISAPGIYSGVPIDTYHGQLTEEHSSSRSFLWTLFDKSPRHALLKWYGNEDRSDEESEALLLGQAAHHMLLGEADFSSHFVFHPETYPEGAEYPSMIGSDKPWNLNAKWCRRWKAAEEEKGREILRPKHLEVVRGMASGLYEQPLVRAGIMNGLIEHTMVWRDKRTGIWVKIRPDAIPNDGPDVADFKTIADISDEGIERAIGDNGLFLQGGMVRRGFRELGLPFETFTLVFAEKAEPYCARIKTLTESDLDLGEKVLDVSLEAYARCIERGVWLGIGGEQTDASYAQMSPWKRRQIETKLELMEKDSRL